MSNESENNTDTVDLLFWAPSVPKDCVCPFTTTTSVSHHTELASLEDGQCRRQTALYLYIYILLTSKSWGVSAFCRKQTGHL